MWRYKLLGFLIAGRMAVLNLGVSVSSLGFEKDKQQLHISRMGNFTPAFLESSGLATDDFSNLYSHNDSGGNTLLYKFNSKGVLQDSIELQKTQNKDWEDLALDSYGNWYVGDFGNNLNRRKDLVIYKVSSTTTELIKFSYADQSTYPPTDAKELNFDCEAMFWWNNQLFLFSKNRGSKWVRAYVVPDQPGDYLISPIDSIYLPHMITGADISPTGETFALLGYGMIYTFDWNHENSQLFKSPAKARKFTRGGQSEAIVYTEENRMVISNERGKLFEIKDKRNLHEN